MTMKKRWLLTVGLVGCLIADGLISYWLVPNWIWDKTPQNDEQWSTLIRSLRTNDDALTLSTSFRREVNGDEYLTVKARLIELAAYLEDGKVYDKLGKELYFYRVRYNPTRVQVQARLKFNRPVQSLWHDAEGDMRRLGDHFLVVPMHHEYPPAD